MNEEKWVLAVIKRYILDAIKASQPYKYEDRVATLTDILNTINRAESDAILGTPTMLDDYVDSLLAENTPGGDPEECADCAVDIGEVDI